MPTDGTKVRRSRRGPGVPVQRVYTPLKARGTRKCVGKGKRAGSFVASSNPATSLGGLQPRFHSDPTDAFRMLRLCEIEEDLAEEPSIESLQAPWDWLPPYPDLVHKMLSYLPSQEHVDVSSPKNLHDATTSMDLSITATSSRDTIWVRYQSGWGLTFYSRIDLSGYFHTYPHVGGPFHSLEEVNSAIDRFLQDRQDPTMCKEQPEVYEVGKESVERGIRECLYWPDGSKKIRVKSEPMDEIRCFILQLVRALVDKYNEDHNLLEDLAFELKEVVCYEEFYEGKSCRHHHVNFTAKAKGAKTSHNLFFAEVTRLPGEDDLVVSCTCMVDPSDNDEGHCYGCGSKVKHPNAGAYTGGHTKSKICDLYGGACPGPNLWYAETMDDWKAEEARIRLCFKGLDDPSVVAQLMEPPNLNFGAVKATDEEMRRFLDSITVHDPVLVADYFGTCGPLEDASEEAKAILMRKLR